MGSQADTKDPQTPEEWQEAVNLADMHLKIEDAKLYGLVKGGPKVDKARCLSILDRGRRQKVHPKWTDEDLQALVAEHNAGASA